MKTLIHSFACFVSFIGLCLSARAQLSFEAEDLVVNREVMQKDKFGDAHWNLWSTDRDAMKKWSGGIVLRSPVVNAERKTPEEGAPPLHLRVTDVPKGIYNVEVTGPGRVAGLSLDGKTWAPFHGGIIAASKPIDGVFEFWFDDRYAMEKEKDRGATYLDRVILYRVLALEDGVSNPGFEMVDGNLASGWSWWSREKKGAAVSVADAHGGTRAVHITHDGERDWAFSCGTRLPVKQGQTFAVRAWVKPKAENGVRADIVGCKGSKTVTWSIGGAGSPSGIHGWTEIKGYGEIPFGVDSVYVRFVGSGVTDAVIDDVSLKAEKITYPKKPAITGWAEKRTFPAMDRGLVALPAANGAYLSWRLLKEDPDGVGFDVYRVVDGKRTRINTDPVVRTCDFFDAADSLDPGTRYEVVPSNGGLSGETGLATAGDGNDALPFLSIKLKDEDTRFMACGFTDLNGDGKLDIVMKHPSANVDPWHKYWKASTETYKIEAYLHDGTYLWTNDLGWAIERGVWYSPWIAVDVTGDGKSEIIAKIGEGDPRDEDGKVTSGPEWLAVWDGMTGKEIARAPWPPRDPFPSYNYYSRNQIAVAYLDGKTPCLLALRGTYNRMLVDAYQFKEGKLEKLWGYDNKEYGRKFWGQGAHFTLCHDVDSDGRDEVILGSAVIDDTGAPLWSTGKGHPDAAYLTDITLEHPGLEMAYVMETRQRNGGGLCVADAATGTLLWGLDTPTGHVHGKGMCADIDPLVPGMEVYGADSDAHKLTEKRWLFSADGEILRQGTDCPWGFGIRTGWWDADLQREIVGGRVTDYNGGVLEGRIEGSIKAIADVIGDWREEVITSLPGELRIYSTVIPAADRRLCLMQDSVYSMCMAMNTMGYVQAPTLSYNLEAVSSGLNLTYQCNKDGESKCQIVVSAPLDKSITARLDLTVSPGFTLIPPNFDIQVAPGKRVVKEAIISGESEDPMGGMVNAVLIRGAEVLLTGQVPVRIAGGFIKKGTIIEAEDITEEAGGKVQIRTDKPGVRGKAISHWDDKGHAITWQTTVPETGNYELVIRYSTPKKTQRHLRLGNQDCGVCTFPSSGGFGSVAHEWTHERFNNDGKPFALKKGSLTIRLENTDGQGLNLDYLVLIPVK